MHGGATLNCDGVLHNHEFACRMGPIFHRELVTLPRRARFFVARTVYPIALTILLATAWLILAGTQKILCPGDAASFGTLAFQLLSLVQVTLAAFSAAVLAASAVSQEKDRKTLTLLLMTQLSPFELVCGKLSASLLYVVALVLSGLPIFFLVTLLGGVAWESVARVSLVTLVTAAAAGSLGVLLGYWREKTFQTLALVVIALCIWLGGSELLAAMDGTRSGFWQLREFGRALSPLRAAYLAAAPFAESRDAPWTVSHPVRAFLVMGLFLTLAQVLLTMIRVRVWSSLEDDRQSSRGGPPSGEFSQPELSESHTAGLSPGDHTETQAEIARAGHVDARRPTINAARHREVWDNPVLWRECATWSHGRRVILIRCVYVLLVAAIAILVHQFTTPQWIEAGYEQVRRLPEVAAPLAALYLMSLAIVNALAVTSITNERDGRALDLLLATELTPQQFLFGKLGGIASVAGLMIVLPILVSVYVCYRGSMGIQSLCYVIGILITLNAFVMMLGIHAGMRYAQSRAAISASLGSFFFLSLGVAVCILLMISFSGSFEFQLVPFMAMILGGGVGLFAVWSAGNPSSALVVAAISVPFFTFYVLTCVLLGHELSAFLGLVGSYGFATAAMMVPALYEFDFAMGRTVVADGDG